MNEANKKFSLKAGSKLVVKIGTSVITNNGESISNGILKRIASQIRFLHVKGVRVILVSSGAIAAGVFKIGWRKRPKKISKLQAAAAVGQVNLIKAYETEFGINGLKTAQILITKEDFTTRKRFLNSQATLNTLLEERIIVIVNENDTVATDEIKLGDNDTLAAQISSLISADLFVILTDQNGLYTENPIFSKDAKLIENVDLSMGMRAFLATESHSTFGTGGMQTKIKAADISAQAGVPIIIANGFCDDILIKVYQGYKVGTRVFSTDKNKTISLKKRWIANHGLLNGAIVLDAGAVHALVKLGKSLLPIGILRVSGDFDRGDLISCLSEEGVEIARGLSNYSSKECSKIKGVLSEEIEKILGYFEESEIIHRDNLNLTLSSAEEEKTKGASSNNADV